MQLCVSAAPPALLVSCVAFFLSFLGAAAGRITCPGGPSSVVPRSEHTDSQAFILSLDITTVEH